MSEIRTDNQHYFPKERKGHYKTAQGEGVSDNNVRAKNSKKRQEELRESIDVDAKVDISNKTKDFSKIKKAVDNSPNIDNRKKVESLRKQVQEGNYKIDYDVLAEKILEQEGNSKISSDN